ncbi:zinc finger, A20-type transcription factor [Phycomyces blakesleeanus]|uniref:Zinc finger, A20-type transcription factor n=1 Tax=Phycomyces blakesleeanus TaxID=4837 RepID=A0ABR3ASP9_PHYBL
MANNRRSPSTSSLCSAGCGFYGSELYGNMCSKCFVLSIQKEQAKQDEPTKASQASNAHTSEMFPRRKHPRSPSPVLSDIISDTTELSTIVAIGDSPHLRNGPQERPVQVQQGRCFRCRVKVPLAKQTINKCRCEYVFCDAHRYPDRHDCEIDVCRLDRVLLAKNNPKLHERPRGGRSFRRIDSP